MEENQVYSCEMGDSCVMKSENGEQSCFDIPSKILDPEKIPEEKPVKEEERSNAGASILSVSFELNEKDFSSTNIYEMSHNLTKKEE